MTILRGLILTAVAFTLSAAAVHAATETRFTIVDSSPTSWIGAGSLISPGLDNYTVTPELGWTFKPLFPGCKCFVDIKMEGPALPGTIDTSWRIMLYSPFGDLQPGLYSDFQRFPFNDDDHPGVSFTATHRGDNTASGYFEVLEATFGPDGTVLSFSANITHYGDTIPANYTIAELRYNASIVPEPSTLLLMLSSSMVMPSRRRKSAPTIASIERDDSG